MTKQKAAKHLTYALEDRDFWREQYVRNEKDTSSVLDIRGFKEHTLREERRIDYIANIKDANERISRYQRIIL